ncbi:exodeoxyribonuclease I [Cellvibrio fontiphilus]|uniref:Exodeoxyribonuclease I n=1 Tax=Cellvibrio fontiphilus TaxID=1815559 RepID=A0ABV7FJU4_9GAMM
MKNAVSASLYWHDYETWGEVPAIDRPSQFAGVRTDEALNVIAEPLMIYCQPAPDVLPKPEACLITGLLPQVAQEKGLPENQFIAAIHRELARPGTCGVGFNSIRFDDEVTRYTLYRNFFDPYEREWRNGNSRWDIIDMVRMTRALRPEGIEWPNYEDGRPCFKLEMLSQANNLKHDAAHDALSDVYATIAVAKLIKTRQPKLYDYAYRLRDKRFAASLIDIDSAKPLLHISSRFPSENGNAALILPLAIHPTNKNSIITYNLSSDPRALLSLPVEALRERLFTRTEDLPEGVERLALKEVHLNKTPMLMPAAMLDDAVANRLGIDKQRCEAHWHLLRNLTLSEREDLLQRLQQLYLANQYAGKTDPEQQLYDGFFDDHDKHLMAKVRTADPSSLAGGEFPFKDSRLAEMLFRYRARNYPASLTPPEQGRWREFCRWRLTSPEAQSSLTLVEFEQRIQILMGAESTTPEQRQLLQRLAGYGAQLLAAC